MKAPNIEPADLCVSQPALPAFPHPPTARFCHSQAHKTPNPATPAATAPTNPAHAAMAVGLGAALPVSVPKEKPAAVVPDSVHMVDCRPLHAALDRLLPENRVRICTAEKGNKRILTNTSRPRSIHSHPPSARDGRPAAAWHDNSHGVAGTGRTQLGGARLVVCAALTDGRGAEARVGEVGGDVGEGEVAVGDVADGSGGRAGRGGDKGCWRRASAYRPVVGCRLGSNMGSRVSNVGRLGKRVHHIPARTARRIASRVEGT
jgi:hypothetical protein